MICYALIFVTRLRFPPGDSIADIAYSSAGVQNNTLLCADSQTHCTPGENPGEKSGCGSG